MPKEGVTELSCKYDEASRRTNKYSKDEELEKFLDVLNRQLEMLEPVYRKNLARGKPVIFILGLHRSGATLITQAIAKALEVGYINNFVARFWLAPVTGIRLSKNLLKDKKEIGFESDFGKTHGIAEPHEFSYFWHHWFKMEDMPPYNPEETAKEIN